jgi:aldose 1-epimerase
MADANLSPNGPQQVLEAGDYRAVISGVGAGLRALSHRGRPLVVKYPAESQPPGGAGQLLIPWPNRIRDGRYLFDGAEYRLPLSEPAHLNAIHGLVRWVRWEVAEQEAERVALTVRLVPQPGYPFALSLRVDYHLQPSGLSVRVEARNDGDRPCPYGAGAHPYVRAGAGLVDDVVLQLPAESVLVADARGIPTGERIGVAGSPYDFREPRQVGATALDTAYTDLVCDGDGVTRAWVATPDGDARVTVWMDSAHSHLMVYTGDTLADRSRRRRGIALEPMTCAPDAFNSGDGMVVLQPGATHAGSWGIAHS